MNGITKYSVELAHCLEKESVEELDKFIETHQEEYSKEMIEAWRVAKFEVKQLAMYKMIANKTNVDNKLRCKARRWLKEHGSSEEIF